MIMSLYQEYLRVIGQLKDVYKLEVETNHRDIHTFFVNKAQTFKLLFGTYESGQNQIVVSFHIDVPSRDAIYWFLNVQYFHPLLKVVDHHIEDDKGETYLGSDATMIQNLLMQRNTLEHWLVNKSERDMKEFINGEVVGEVRNPKQSFNSQAESGKAIMKFKRIQKPDDGEDSH